MSVSVEQYNALLARVERLEAAAGITWDTPFTPATGGFAAPAVNYLDMPVHPSITLLSTAELSHNEFHAGRRTLPTTGTFTLLAERLPTSPAEVEAWCRDAHLFTIASGDMGDAMKWMLFGKDTVGSFHLLEAVLEKATKTIVVTVKSYVKDNASLAANAFKAALRNLPAACLAAPAPVVVQPGEVELMVKSARTTERGAENCIFWNPATVTPVPETCYVTVRNADSPIVVAKLDSTLEGGVVETGIFTRLNCSLALNQTSVFATVTEELPACARINISLSPINIRPSSGPSPLSHTEILNSLRGCYIRQGNQCAVVDTRNGGKLYYKATIQQCSNDGRVTDETLITIV